MCLYPRLSKNKKYIPNKKNGGQVPPVFDNRVLTVPIGCGKCMECQKQKGREWRVRLLEDIRHNKNGIFITLTFSDESIKELIRASRKKQVKLKNKDKIETKIKLEGYELDNEIAKIATRRFLERWRKTHGKSLRHWLVTELGHNGTENIHMHGIIWTNKSSEEIKKHWQYGYIWAGNEGVSGGKENYVNEKTISYLTKYIYKQDNDHKEYKPIILTSAGIGSEYIKRIDAINNKYQGKNTKEYYKSRSGTKEAIPSYWRNKIYTDEEREKLWINKLDEKIRYVDGIKVDISKDEKEYYRILKEARIKNDKLGYGNDRTDWNRKKYEEDRRIMLQQKRVERATEKAIKNAIEWGNSNAQ